MRITTLCNNGVTWLRQNLSLNPLKIGREMPLTEIKLDNMPRVAKKAVKKVAKKATKKAVEVKVLTKKERMAERQGQAK